MPTPGGLPKAGEIWERTFKLPPKWELTTFSFIVIERGRGEYWSLRVFMQGYGKMLWVDASAWFKQGQLKYIGQAGPKTRERLGLGRGV